MKLDSIVGVGYSNHTERLYIDVERTVMLLLGQNKENVYWDPAYDEYLMQNDSYNPAWLAR